MPTQQSEPGEPRKPPERREERRASSEGFEPSEEPVEGSPEDYDGAGEHGSHLHAQERRGASGEFRPNEEPVEGSPEDYDGAGEHTAHKHPPRDDERRPSP